ncbi:acetyl-CoA hydrolase/transferase family protein [Pseudomonas nicosulfuronedens]|uniref:Acetyl-CoA hydrolase/transferase family protein n=1 Tax=Pseudomonas nicosulfuronedens TaxID=2571105 RepID=A0A5R9QM51_9PSED|nr:MULTISPECIES: acetyl-CoA hydrolase/transferase C-terminal domain-containing protein [Pseudomonas]TLX70646.1 acetyl-CoA hydrolase/transferase family protein [Pseudomonas nicosulfuronedens]
MAKLLSQETLDLTSLIRPGDTVLWGQANAEPLPLTKALMEQRHDLGRIRVLLGIPNSDSCRPEHADKIDFLSYCGSGANRQLAKAGALDILPCHYSEFPQMIRSGLLRVDVLLLQLAPADEQGRYSLGLAHEYLLPALETARVVIAEVNQACPWTYGERYLYEDDLDAILHSDRAPLESPLLQPGPMERSIAERVAGLIEDGSTLQLGIGAIPEAVVQALEGHRELGIHSGTIGDGVADLIRQGVITNSRKTLDTGLTVAGVLMGSRALHRFAHRNPQIHMRSTDYTHNPEILAGQDRLVAINSAIEVDLSGQINAETAAGNYVGALGGAVDFLRGARRSHGGLPIIALPSTAGPNSRIVARLSGPVSTPRCDAGLIVSEYGIADLRGLSLRQRVRRMIDIAHPQFREQLERDAASL